MRRDRIDRRLGPLLGGVVLLAFVALGGSVALPAGDATVRSLEGARTLDGTAERGRDIYRSEGCWYCHTQQVRPTPIDAAYGEPLPGGAYANDQPILAGGERIGPDLTHVGSRLGEVDLRVVLRDPRRAGRLASMPSYTFLSDEDIDALVAYLMLLR